MSEEQSFLFFVLKSLFSQRTASFHLGLIYFKRARGGRWGGGGGELGGLIEGGFINFKRSPQVNKNVKNNLYNMSISMSDSHCPHHCL